MITTPKGYRDETTRVLWLQTRSWYADIRVKADRPKREGATGFAEYTDAELIQMAAVQGFAGELSATGNVCLWRRDLDYQPPNDSVDEATFAVADGVMIEDGIHSEYQEIWRHQAPSATPLAAYSLVGETKGLLVIAGDYFLEIRDRATPMAPAESLTAYVSEALAKGERDAAVAALSMRICHGQLGRLAPGDPVVISLARGDGPGRGGPRRVDPDRLRRAGACPLLMRGGQGAIKTTSAR
uniref:Uncharacterized protein n=1 Tax=Phenylobacterium glaciei TaxID=2803784 RepID=A0A974P4K5_9CAUL|nr:hypothetical protein JKL49_06655 [Phenylobacterium glaciei]